MSEETKKETEVASPVQVLTKRGTASRRDTTMGQMAAADIVGRSLYGSICSH